jgi:hypothetical protein
MTLKYAWWKRRVQASGVNYPHTVAVHTQGCTKCKQRPLRKKEKLCLCGCTSIAVNRVAKRVVLGMNSWQTRVLSSKKEVPQSVLSSLFQPIAME